MPIPPNIDLFNRFSLAVFQQLYLSFPARVEIEIGPLMMSVIPNDSQFEETFQFLTVGGEAIDFLATEGFLTHEGKMLDGSQFLQVRLTLKGLAILGSVPTSLERCESLISKILGVAGKGIKDAAAEQVSELSNQAFSLALASAPALAAAVMRS